MKPLTATLKYELKRIKKEYYAMKLNEATKRKDFRNISNTSIGGKVKDGLRAIQIDNIGIPVSKNEIKIANHLNYFFVNAANNFLVLNNLSSEDCEDRRKKFRTNR